MNYILLNIKEALHPPKPNEFEIAVFTTAFLATLGTKSKSQASDGVERFKVGGKIPCLIARIEKIASIAPAAPSRCPVADFVEDIGVFVSSPSYLFTDLTSISSPSGVEVPCAFT